MDISGNMAGAGLASPSTITATASHGPAPALAAALAKPTATVFIQLFPHFEQPHGMHTHPFRRNFTFAPVERELVPGTVVRIGRRVEKAKDHASTQAAANQAVAAVAAAAAATTAAAAVASPSGAASPTGGSGALAGTPIGGGGSSRPPGRTDLDGAGTAEGAPLPAVPGSDVAAMHAAAGLVPIPDTPSGVLTSSGLTSPVAGTGPLNPAPSASHPPGVATAFGSASGSVPGSGPGSALASALPSALPSTSLLGGPGTAGSGTVAAPAAGTGGAAVPEPKQEFIAFRSKVVSRTHAELVISDDLQVYFRDVGSSSGTFLNRLRLSPTGKESRPYPLKSGDILQLGVDYQGRQEEVYKSVMMKIFITVNRNAAENRPRMKPLRLKLALRNLLVAMTPSNRDASSACTDCCICLSTLAPSQALFLAPCSHCFHYKCVVPLLKSGGGVMFQCPLCRQVANLEANVSIDEIEWDDEDIAHLEALEAEADGEAVASADGTRSGGTAAARGTLVPVGAANALGAADRSEQSAAAVSSAGDDLLPLRLLTTAGGPTAAGVAESAAAGGPMGAGATTAGSAGGHASSPSAGAPAGAPASSSATTGVDATSAALSHRGLDPGDGPTALATLTGPPLDDGDGLDLGMGLGMGLSMEDAMDPMASHPRDHDRHDLDDDDDDDDPDAFVDDDDDDDADPGTRHRPSRAQDSPATSIAIPVTTTGTTVAIGPVATRRRSLDGPGPASGTASLAITARRRRSGLDAHAGAGAGAGAGAARVSGVGTHDGTPVNNDGTPILSPSLFAAAAEAAAQAQAQAAPVGAEASQAREDGSRVSSSSALSRDADGDVAMPPLPLSDDSPEGTRALVSELWRLLSPAARRELVQRRGLVST